ncbi:LysR family transcriptional regulator [Eggerthella guodeyinii]|uniref:LysR family transcriptional regulator n=1 Tax=Eggerthella guodeyinii TaxID=2690837 RepID=A0A7M1ZU10_9ACTN|nr:LysR family transcriptional regulator [Eggerthella guodeyinii]
MNIKQIRYFASAVAHGSLTAAAKHEYVSVQAISKSLSDLERELGYSLFSRKSHGIAPTAFGNAFLREATSVLKGFERLETFATCWGGGCSNLRARCSIWRCACRRSTTSIRRAVASPRWRSG